jgi:hypothetical protein
MPSVAILEEDVECLAQILRQVAESAAALNL